MGRWRRARHDALEQSIRLFEEVDSAICRIGSLRLLSAVLHEEGNGESAGAALAESDRICRAIGIDGVIPACFLGLGALAEPGVTRGNLPRPDARTIPKTLPPPRNSIIPAVPLSERESEVLALVGAGMTNPEIANALFISPNTVKRHLANIFDKLGVENRVVAATYAVTERALFRNAP